jgi:membrane-associated phospholipid phosphatase
MWACLCLCGGSAAAFSLAASPAPAVALRPLAPALARSRTGPAVALAASNDDGPLRSALDTANGLTKWLVVAAQTTAVVTRRDFASPYIVVGSIGASFGAHALKRLINQQRPDGAPFIDPGMPSSHALVATFAASAWAVHLQRAGASVALLASAAVVSGLRVVTGCHTWAQVIVGIAVGAAGALAWMGLGVASGLTPPGAASTAALAIMYSVYLGGSALFVVRKMDKWDWRK